MATYRQINYIKTLLSQASRKTKEAFEESGVLLNKDTPDRVIQDWIKHLEQEVRKG